jgi:hypothetical protein
MDLRLHHRLSDIPAAAWDDLFGTDNPFVTHAYLGALEDTACVGGDTGWYPQHLSVTDEDGALVAALPLYLKTHSMGEYVFDQSWARAYEQAGGRYYPRLVSCSPFTPVTGPRLAAKTAAARTAAIEGLAGLCARNQLSSAHILFPAEDEWKTYGAHGFLLRQDRQFWWHNDGFATFDDFLAALSSNRRKVIRRERRDVAACVTCRVHEGADITEAHLDHLYGFIQSTYDKKWGAPYLTRDFFSAVPRENMVLVFAYAGETPVAGAINFKSGKRLYGRQWGANVDIPFLHFEVCYYQAIDYAIRHGLHCVEAGTQGEHKLMRGYLPQAVYSAHYIADARLRRPVADYLDREREAVRQEMDYLAEEASPFKKG